MRNSIIAATALSFSASMALAADLSQEEQLPEPPAVEQVAPVSSNYIALRLGAAFPKDTEFNALGTTIINDYEKHSITGSAAIGHKFDAVGIPLRGELEAGYLKSDIESHNVIGTGVVNSPDAFGSTKTLYGLANAYYDFDTGTNVTPFVGAGIGAGKVDFQNHGVTGPGTALDDNGIGLAWQVGGGVNVDIAQNVGVELGYKYLNVENVGVNAADGTSNSIDVRNHMATAGIKLGF